MEEMLKMWFSNKLEHLEGLEISGKIVLPKQIVSNALLAPKETTSENDDSEEDSLKAKDYNNILNHIRLNKFNLKLAKNKVVIGLDIQR